MDYIGFDEFKSIVIPYLIEDEAHNDFSAYRPEGLDILKALRSAVSLPLAGRDQSAIDSLSHALNPYREEHLRQCFEIFEKAHNISLLILGTREIRESPELLDNFGKLTYESPSSTGVILSTNDWSPLMNDLMIMGAYMNGTPLHIYSKSIYPKTKDLRTSTEDRMLARELRIATECLHYMKLPTTPHEKTSGVQLKLPSVYDLTYNPDVDKKTEFMTKFPLVRAEAARGRLSDREIRALLGGTGSRPPSPMSSSPMTPGPAFFP